MAFQIQCRRDTAANWTSTNPTLAQGEEGFETDTKLIKIGDGSTAWRDLSYWNVREWNIRLQGLAYASTTVPIWDWNSRIATKILGVYTYVDTAPAGTTLLTDVHVNGTTIFSTQTNRPTIADGGTSGSSVTIEAPTVAAGQKIELFIDQVGSTAGSPGGNHYRCVILFI